MPAEDRLGLNERDRSPPTREQSRGDDKSKPVEIREPWTSCPSTENNDLVSEDDVLEE
jgi:hypothetical protein